VIAVGTSWLYLSEPVLRGAHATNIELEQPTIWAELFSSIEYAFGLAVLLTDGFHRTA
jgi:hypothetical protein